MVEFYMFIHHYQSKDKFDFLNSFVSLHKGNIPLCCVGVESSNYYCAYLAL